MLWERWPKAKFLGLTATPCRLNGAPFTDLFDTLLQSWSIVDFIRKGWLSDMDYVSVRATCKTVRRIVGLDKRSVDGDFQTAQMALVLDTPESIGQLYAAYKEYADGKKGIVYAINREHARHIADYYQNHGVNCCLIDSKTPRQERQQMVTDYLGGGRKGERFRSLPDKLQRISPISYIYYLRDLKMQTLRKNPPRFVD